VGCRASRRFARANGGDLPPPFLLKRRLATPRRERFGAIVELPPGGYRFELLVTAWMRTPPRQRRDDISIVEGFIVMYRESRLVRRAGRGPN
jgi:hypothetical protein